MRSDLAGHGLLAEQVYALSEVESVVSMEKPAAREVADLVELRTERTLERVDDPGVRHSQEGTTRAGGDDRQQRPQGACLDQLIVFMRVAADPRPGSRARPVRSRAGSDPATPPRGVP